MKATINAEGLPTGFYTVEVNGEHIPEDAIDISLDDWQAHLNGDLRWYNETVWEPYTPPFDPVAAAAVQKATINAACATAIVAGFDSAALGDTHHYDCEQHDQISIIGLVAANIDHPYTCIDAATVKASKPHTAAQIRQVFDDGLVHISGNTTTARTLKDQLDTLAEDPSTTQDDIDAVVW